MYPTDLWPNGVEVPFEEFTVYKNKFIGNGNNTMYDDSNWDVILIPIKSAHRIVMNDSTGEWTYFLDENLTVPDPISSNSCMYTNIQTIPFYAKYIGKNLRRHRTFSGVTFYYYPTNGNDKNVVFQQYRTESPDNSFTTPLIPCHGYHTLYTSAGARGTVLWYGKDKNYLFSRGYGTESGVYEIPEGAYYCKLQTYKWFNAEQNPKGSSTVYWLE